MEFGISCLFLKASPSASEGERPEDLSREEVEFEVRLEPEVPAYCTDCHIKMEPTKYEVKISSDGRNYLIRFPKELSKTLATKKTAKILPIDADEFVVKVM